MVILQLKLHTQPQEQLEQVAQGCGQLGFKCLNGWRLHLKRHVTGFDQKCYKKRSIFWYLNFIPCISVHAHCLLSHHWTPQMQILPQTGITYLHVQQRHQSSPAQKGLGAFTRESSRYILNRAIINLLPDPNVRKRIHLCCYWLNYRQ